MGGSWVQLPYLSYIEGTAWKGLAMTGQKDRYSTTEKLWNLDDKQLTTPKHDELVLMLLDKGYSFTKVCEQFLPKIPDGKDKWEIKVIKSEVPISGSNGFIIGYWDVVIKCETPYYETRVNQTPDGNTFTTNTGIFDDRCFLIECKPDILSFGETLRQLNTYLKYNDITYRRNNWWAESDKNQCILFTPDTRFKNAFESQDIPVISP